MCDVEIRIRNSAKNHIFRNRNIVIFSYHLSVTVNLTITAPLRSRQHQYHHHNRQFVTNTVKFPAIIFTLKLKVI